MADTKLINWAYPFKTAGEDSQEVSDPQIYLDALAKAKDGFYPMGANGLWHGGVHFDTGSAALLDQSTIRCIADGEVIAYRIDDKYPETPYAATSQPGMGPEPVGAKYSTGFVLVRHRLVLPSVPTPSTPSGETSDSTTAATPTDSASPAAAGAETAPASEGLTFYSLYMHLLDWVGYQATSAPKPAEFLAPSCYAVKSTTSDSLVGLRIRALTEDGTSEVLALLPKGCKVTLGETHSIKSQYKRLLSIDEGSAIPALPADTVGWVYEPELTGNTVADKATDTEPTLTLSHQGLNVRRESNRTGTIIGVLPRGATLKVGEKQRSGYCKVLEVMDYRGVPVLPDGPDGKPLGYVYFDELETQHGAPSVIGSVHILPKPYAINAGELVGHMGKYQNQGEGTAKQRLHLEVFTSEDVPAFIEKSRAIGEKLPDEQKTLIKVDKGSKIVQPVAADAQVETGVDVRLSSDSPKAGCWAKVQKYAICNADKNSELGSYNSTKLTYTLGAAQKTTLATRMGIDAADLPDQVDFLKVYSNSADGGDPHDYESGSIPSTHPWRKIGAFVGKPFWVKRSALNAQGRRTSTAGSLDAWSEFPLHSGLEGEASGYVRILPAGSWDALPDERKAIDAEQVRWWYVTVGGMEGSDISGWAPEKDLIVTRHSPWEWPGFSTLQDKLPLDAHLARTLDATGRAKEEETSSYAALIEEAERGPILSKLYEIIDQPDEKGVRDNKLTPEEFKAALAKPWLAQQLSLLISQHESEWFWNESKWNQLDKLMEHTPEDPNPQWVREKERIKTLSWWKELAGQPGIAADGVAWHFQPTGMIGAFCQEMSLKITLEMLVRVFKTADVKKLSALVVEMNSKLKEYKLDTPLRLSHFFAQVRVEVGDNYALVESLRYRPEKLLDFSYFASRPEEAELYGFKPGLQEANQVEIANRAYNGVTGNKDLGNGDIASGDGWRYRGRGLKQLTGRYNYTQFNLHYSELWPSENVDFVTNPDRLEEPKYAARSAVYFWLKNRLYEIADQGPGDTQVNSITEIINKRTASYGERRKQFKRIWADEKIFN